MGRINKDKYYMGIAKAVLKRSTCNRRQYGAVIVKDDIIIATGYNGSARGKDNCCDLGFCYREANDIPHGQRYEECVAIHAEQNAINVASGRDLIGATLYLCGEENGKQIDARPCLMCQRAIDNARIGRVVCSDASDIL